MLKGHGAASESLKIPAPPPSPIGHPLVSFTLSRPGQAGPRHGILQGSPFVVFSACLGEDYALFVLLRL